MLAHLASDKFLRSLDRLEQGRVALTLPNGREYFFAGKKSGPDATMRVSDWSVFKNLAQAGDTALAADYADGKWTTDNIQSLITLALQNEQAVRKFIFGSAWINVLYNLSYLLRSNTQRGSRRNIRAHYDLGNDFYRLWLDPGMTYSSAMYRHESENLVAAQNNKYDRILDTIGTDTGRMLEIGCGWGGYAERALQRGDFDIKGITLSDEQLSYAQQRLHGDARLALEDYRAQNGKYDHIVSIEMFEAVGEKYWHGYFAKIADLMKTGGKTVIQSITIDDRLFKSYRRGQDFVRSFIFPGGMLPSPERFEAAAARAGLQVKQRHDFGQDYARTLEEWLNNFDAQKIAVANLGFDDRFIRMWRFYLAACAAGFRTGRTDVSQFELQHA